MGLALLFPGQGSQSSGMGAELFDDYPAEVAAADGVLGYSIRELCLSGDSRLHRTQFAQPALYVVSALSYLRYAARSGARPQYLAGHSLGELSALFAAGCFDFETGLRLVRRRGELMGEAVGGGMAAVLGVPPERLLALLERAGIGGIDIANHNSPEQVVVAGPKESIRALADLIAEQGTGKCVPLNVSIAAHSRYMADAAQRFAQELRAVRFAPPSIPVIANVTGRPHTVEAIPDLLTRHLCSPVRWWDTMRLLAAEGVDRVEEIGPGTVLTRMWDKAQPQLPQAAATKSASPLIAEEAGVEVVVLSAADRPVLDRYAQLLLDHLTALPSGAVPALADVAHTLQVGRVPMSHRLAVAATDVHGLTEALGAYLAGRPHPALATGIAKADASAVNQRPATLAEAAEAWLQGVDVPWERYRHNAARRVSLPAYPRGDGHRPAVQSPVSPKTPVSSEKALRYLTGLYAEVSGIEADRLDPRVPLAQYGVSSFLVTRLNARLEQDLGESDRTLFFAHADLAAVAETLAARHPSLATAPVTAAVASPREPDPAAGSAADPASGFDDGAIAVIGLAGRYPQAPDLARFWENLSQGRDSVSRIPAHRVAEGWPADLMWGGFLDEVDRFDPLLFNISPRDAELMDPQERLFLEAVWEALEDAGYPRTRLAERHDSNVAVYAGAMHNEYPYFGVEQSRGGRLQDSGATLGGIANRVSFCFDLNGPSMSVDTMCSSSLTAIHLAVRTLRAGEAQVAIAGAVNLSLHPNKFVQQHRMRLVSSTRRCRSFGAGGDGFVPSEGVGVVVLKPLRRALADGDRVHAVIRGTSVVHAGRTNGYLVPNPNAQGRMVAAALRDAGADAADIGYLELHGAGTALGDPVEIKGLMEVFGGLGLAPGSIPIGSVKSTIGHVEAAAGIAGLAKVILQMRHGGFAPSLHAEELNPGIAWDEVPFRVQRTAEPWPAGPHPRLAGISSFGAGGTIAHVVVEEAPAAARRPGPFAASREPQLIVLSAYDRQRLEELAGRLASGLRDPARIAATAGAYALADVAYTLQVGREALRERLAVVAESIDELCDLLDGYAHGRPAEGRFAFGRVPSAGYAVGPARSAADADLAQLGRHWVEGGAVDWERAHLAGRRPRIVTLPNYPFARMRCWLPEDDGAPSAFEAVPSIAGAVDTVGTADTGTTSAEVPLYERTWQSADPLGAPAAPDRPLICVFSDRSETLARTLADRLGHSRVLLVREGGHHGDGIAGFVTAGEAEQLAETLLDRHPDLNGWLDLADLHRTDAERGLWQARLAMLRRVVGRLAATGLRVLQVADGLLDLAGGAPPSLAAARVAGFVRVIGAEYRRLSASVLDTDVPADQPQLAADRILAEWAHDDPCGEVCHRGAVRYSPALRPLDLPHRPLRADPVAAYVVTGGTRGLGAVVARLLVRRGARKLALLAARPLSEDGEAAEQIRRLRGEGAEVLVHTGPLTDRVALDGFLAAVRAQLGPIGGIVHCAGRSGSAQPGFAYQDPDEVRAVCEPKTDGLDALVELTAADHPGFFLQFSSVCAAVPAVAAGVTDYAAANAYLDYTVGHQARNGRTGFRAVNWPQWSESGGGRGLPNPCAEVGLGTLGDEEGLRVLERVLGAPGGVRVLPAPPLDGRPADPATLLAARGRAADDAPRLVESASAAPRPRLVETTRPAGWLVEIFAAMLRLPLAELDVTASFGDLGVESIMLGELMRAIEKRLGRPLEPATLLEHATLRKLSTHLGVDEVDNAEAEEAIAPSPPPTAASAEAVTRFVGPPAPRPVPASTRIAVVGMACRFPGAPDTDAFWANLLAGHCAVDEVPASRWDHTRHYRPTPQDGYSISKWGGFVTGIEDFDAGYFHLSDEEARCLDPAIRMVLEGTATCLRDAGYDDHALAGLDVGVFVGARMSDYGRRVGVRSGALRSDQNFVAAHVAHHFDLHGPNLVVDSACSSSLLAVQLAVRSLLAGETEAALAAGVEVLLDEQPYLDLSAAHALSPEGRCFTFDERADGFVPAEGCGVVLLKTLDAALAAGDRIRAVIEAVAVNNDGRTMGITTPNPAAQAAVVRRALEAAGRRPDEIGMVEAHGTGTLIGDPIELRALAEVYSTDTRPPGSCAIGSVKSNLGHPLTAAGMAGLAKVVLALEHGQIPATLGCETPNPRFDFAHSPFTPSTARRPWTAPPAQRVAGLSSFGLGGTNAHLIASGFDSALREGRPQARTPLTPPRFNRRRLWLDAAPEPAGNGDAPHGPGPAAAETSSLLEFDLTIADGAAFGPSNAAAVR